MVCHEFKGGIGTASACVAAEATAAGRSASLVQANYGEREQLRIDGVPVGPAIPVSDVPSPYDPAAIADEARATADAARPRPRPEPGAGSIIVIVATDAPLLPHQCERIAQRATLGLARMGSTANHSSGDLFLAFATGNRGLATTDEPGAAAPVTHDVRMVARQPDDAAVQGDGRGDGGGRRQRPPRRPTR